MVVVCFHFSVCLFLFYIKVSCIFSFQKAKGKAALKNRGGKKKKVALKFSIDCSKPVEDGIMNVTDFVSIHDCEFFICVEFSNINSTPRV